MDTPDRGPWADPRARRFLVLGPPGSGKSAILTALAPGALSPAPAITAEGDPIPWQIIGGDVYIEARPDQLAQVEKLLPGGPSGVIYVADALRCAPETEIPAITASFPGRPTLVLINKVDGASSREVTRIKALVRQKLPGVRVEEVSARDRFGIGGLLERIQAMCRPVGEAAGTDAGLGERELKAREKLLVAVSDFFIRMERVPRVLLMGAQNSGKSRLFNRLLGRETAKVSARANTTIEPQFEDLSGLKLIDMPAVPSASDLPPGAKLTLPPADVMIYLVNATGRISDLDQKIVESMAPKIPTLLLVNKVDVLAPEELEQSLTALEATFHELKLPPIAVSAKTGGWIRSWAGSRSFSPG